MRHISQVFREYRIIKQVENLACRIQQQTPHHLLAKPVAELSMDDFCQLVQSQKEAHHLAGSILQLLQEMQQDSSENEAVA
jgi:hypothetical protein